MKDDEIPDLPAIHLTPDGLYAWDGEHRVKGEEKEEES